MLLTIDVGNTHTVLGLFDGEEVIEHWRINTDARRTADEIAVVLQGLIQQSPLFADSDISGMVLAMISAPPYRTRVLASSPWSIRGELRQILTASSNIVIAVSTSPLWAIVSPACSSPHRP